MRAFLYIGLALLGQLVVLLAVMALEARYPARRYARPQRAHNVGMGAAVFASQFLAAVWLGPIITLVINAAGGGLIVLPSKGAWLVGGVLSYLVAMDFGEYLFHRAQHAIPALWAMHTLHHSDPQFNATTTVRHFWLDNWLKAMTVWLAVGVLFKTSPSMVIIYGLINYCNFLTHANVRLNFGAGSWLWNSPAYHRLHHSSRSEHFDCNFAALLPIFDVACGSYRRPKKDEFPETGLDDGQTPQSILQALLWPWRTRFADPAADVERGFGRLAD